MIFGMGSMNERTNASLAPWINFKTDIRNVEILYGIKNVSSYSFEEYTNLTTAILPDGLEIIGKSAFKGCSALEKLVLPDSVRVIEEYAFQGISITFVRIPKMVEIISSDVFR